MVGEISALVHFETGVSKEKTLCIHHYTNREHDMEAENSALHI